MSDSRLSAFYRLSVPERIEALRRQGWLSSTDAERLRDGRQVLSSVAADKIIENVVGVFGLPFAIAPNFLVNGEDRLVPLVVEEPSIVAALSKAARVARATGGFRAGSEEAYLAGQVHITGVKDPEIARQRLLAGKRQIVDEANAVHPRLVGRGGGVGEVDVRAFVLPDGDPLLVVHLLVDTVDAMGANLVNSMCEAVAPTIADLSGGNVALRILSNLADRSVVRASVRIRCSDLGGGGFDGAAVRDAIVMANDIARVDPHRAATHNKGIMNGVDALAIATGNDWRAIEAGAHAYAALNRQYGPLTLWSVDEGGDLLGEIAMPLKIGTVGGTLDANPAAALGLAVTGVRSSAELGALMAAVGLAQNFAALRALASSGIQAGHMKLHARSIVAAVGTPDEYFDTVVSRLVASGEIKSWKAREILAAVEADTTAGTEVLGTAAGKVILFGEHAAVYGRHALALPLVDAVRVRIAESGGGLSLSIPAWGIARRVESSGAAGIDAAIGLIVKSLGSDHAGMAITVDTSLPRAMGLGSSAAIAVAVVRAVGRFLGSPCDDKRVNQIAFECEKLAHGTPSGVDNTISTYAQPMLFRNDGGIRYETLRLAEVPPIVIASSHQAGLTSQQVAAVRSRYERLSTRYEALFDEIDAISRQGAQCLQAADYAELGLLMNVCHGLLNAIQVSTPELEHIVSLARTAGAVGAKLTGGGGGGSVVALCPDSMEQVQTVLREAGYRTLVLEG